MLARLEAGDFYILYRASRRRLDRHADHEPEPS
jgi:hypothetical protein